MLDVFVITFYSLPLILILAYIFWDKKYGEDHRSRKRIKNLRRTIERCTDEVSVDALVQAFNENEIAAKAKYCGKLISVEGRILSVSLDLFTPIVSLVSVKSYECSVIARMQTSETKRLEDVKIRDRVNVYGGVTGPVKYNVVEMVNCRIATKDEKDSIGHQ